MLSVIIATLNSEGGLARTLASLVPGAIDGVISEVIVADGGSADNTATVADVAGCKFLLVDGAAGRRLKAAAAAGRKPWLLFVPPGAVLEPEWTGAVSRFIAESSGPDRAALICRRATAQRPLGRLWRLLTGGLADRSRAALLVSQSFYNELGGHSEDAAEPEQDLLRRIGRRRLATLSGRDT